jgi:outer membrane lipoprotein-sorting protein
MPLFIRNNRHYRVRVALLLIIAAAGVSGCSSQKESIGIDRSLGAGEVIAMVNARSAFINTFYGEGSISIQSPRITQSAGFEVDVKKPDSVRLVIEGPFGMTVVKALLTRKNFTAYSALQNTVYTGRTDMQKGFMKMIDIPPAVLIDAFTGFRRFDSNDAEPDSFYIAGNTFVVKFLSSSGWKVFTVDGDSHCITRVAAFDSSGQKILWREEYDYEENGQKQWEPVAAHVSIPEKETIVDLTFNSVTFNPVLDALTISYPDDAEQITIE